MIKELFLNFKEEDFFSKINLHIHSNISDGMEDFDTLIEQAISYNMKYISITDHNSVSGYEKSKYKDHPILITGIEFDCFYGMSVLHILGYGIDIENKDLKAFCAYDEKGRKDDILRLFKSRCPKNVINAIHSSGGIAVLAHPCCSSVLSLDNYVYNLKKLGLDGIEVYYPYDRFRGILKFAPRSLPFKLAQKYNLIKTGGSDEHGSLKIDFS